MWTLQDQHRQENGYPYNRQDFTRSLEYLKTLDIDIWLGAHPSQNSTFSKYERLMSGKKPNPFIDPGGWRRFISKLESDFKGLLAEE